MGANAKIRAGLVTPSISRQAGGLFVSVRRLAQVLQETIAVDVFVASLKDSFAEKDVLNWAGVQLNLFEVYGPHAFGYAKGLLRHLIQSELDVLHTQGLWMYPSVAVKNWASLTGKPYIITPRGMLDSWAVRNAHLKKRIAAWLYEDSHLQGAFCLHALCESEASAIRSFGLSNPICIIPNGIDTLKAGALDVPRWRSAIPDTAKILFFLGRLHPKKGLPNLLHAWADATDACQASNLWHLVIAGWDQGGHEASLKAQCRDLGIQERVHFVGSQFGVDKDSSYHQANAFILPSFSEGLPMVVLEAWSNGLPVLMTPQCNLPEGFHEKAALQIEAIPESIEQGLRTLFAMSDYDLSLMGDRGRALVLERFSWTSVAEQMLSVYQWVLGRGSKPDCVVCD